MVRRPPPNGYQTVRTRSGLATTVPNVPVAGPRVPATLDSRAVRIAAPLGPVTRSRPTPARRVTTPLPAKPRKIRLVEKFGGRRLQHHASIWRRVRSFIGILLIGLVIASILATVIAVIVGLILVAVHHALH